MSSRYASHLFEGGKASALSRQRKMADAEIEDVSNKIEAENMTQTAEGQTELLRTAMQAAQKGQPMDATTQAALQKAMQYEMQKAQQQQIMQQQVAYPQQLSYMA